MKNNQYMLATAILAGGLIFVSTGQAQQQPGKGEPGKGQAKPGQGKAGPGKGQRPGQGGQRPGQGRSQRGGGFNRPDPFASLELKEEQKKKLDAARQEMTTQMRALFSRDNDTPREERTAKLQKAREAYEATIKKVLTEKQMKKYQEARSAQGGRGQGQGQGRRPGQGGAGGRGSSLASLNLTEEQKKKVTAIQTEQRAETTKLFQGLRNGGGDFQAIREKMTTLREKYDKQIEALLTDEQKKKFKEIQAQRSQRGQRRPGGQPGGGRPRPDGKSKERPKRSDA
jgi:Spy/CpxP family protein refolding chaperone